MLNVEPWSSQDRKRLQDWIDSNQYRAAFLCHVVPLKPNTLDRILRGYHDPSGLLRQRIRDVLDRYAKGQPLPHPQNLISA